MTFDRIRDRLASLRPGSSRMMAERAFDRWTPAILELDQAISEGRYLCIYDLSEKHNEGLEGSWNVRRQGLANYLELTGFLNYYDDKLERVVRRKINRVRQPVREKLMEYLLPSYRKRSPRDAIMHWIPVILELDRAIFRNTFISIRAAAMKHNNLASSCHIFLKRVGIYDYYQNKLSVIRDEIREHIKEIKTKETELQQKKRSYEKDQLLAQIIFDLEDGLSVKEIARKNNINYTTVYGKLHKLGLMEKYRVGKLAYEDDIRQQALQLRQQGLTLRAVAAEVGVSKSTVALWDKIL